MIHGTCECNLDHQVQTLEFHKWRNAQCPHCGCQIIWQY